MSKYFPKCPTSEQCNNRDRVDSPFKHEERYALYSFQMGGYCSKAVVSIEKGAHCFDLYIWHDLEFPTSDSEEPTQIHFCSADQLIDFAEFVLEKQELPDE